MSGNLIRTPQDRAEFIANQARQEADDAEESIQKYLHGSSLDKGVFVHITTVGLAEIQRRYSEWKITGEYSDSQMEKGYRLFFHDPKGAPSPREVDAYLNK